jgi:hypothetical protein
VGGRYDLSFTLDDEDWFSFRLSLPGIIRVGTEGGLDTQLNLYGPGSSSTEIASDDDGGDEYNARITKYLEAGVYYVRVSPYDGGDPGPYSLVLEALDIKADSGEPDDSRSQAGTFSTARQPLDLTLFPGGDQDWFRIDFASFQYRAGEVLSLYTSGDIDTYIELYQGDLLLAENDDSEGSENARVTFLPERGKEYYVKIRGYDEAVVGEYALCAETASVEFDQYEPNNTAAQATAVSINQTLSGNALADYDTVDWFTFSVTQPGTYAAGTTGGMDTVITLYDDRGREIGDDDDSGTNENALVEIDLERGTYKARVSLYGGGYGEYSFFVRRR